MLNTLAVLFLHNVTTLLGSLILCLQTKYLAISPTNIFTLQSGNVFNKLPSITIFHSLLECWFAISCLTLASLPCSTFSGLLCSEGRSFIVFYYLCSLVMKRMVFWLRKLEVTLIFVGRNHGYYALLQAVRDIFEKGVENPNKLVNRLTMDEDRCPSKCFVTPILPVLWRPL